MGIEGVAGFILSWSLDSVHSRGSSLAALLRIAILALVDLTSIKYQELWLLI